MSLIDRAKVIDLRRNNVEPPVVVHVQDHVSARIHEINVVIDSWPSVPKIAVHDRSENALVVDASRFDLCPSQNGGDPALSILVSSEPLATGDPMEAQRLPP